MTLPGVNEEDLRLQVRLTNCPDLVFRHCDMSPQNVMIDRTRMDEVTVSMASSIGKLLVSCREFGLEGAGQS